MGKVRMGILDGFYGKVGTVVGSFWKGKAVMRAYVPPKSKGSYAPTEAQALVNTRFAAIGNLASAFYNAILLGFKHVARAKRVTEGNVFVELNWRYVHADTPGSATIDYEELQIARGNLPEIRFGSASFTNPLQVAVALNDSATAPGADSEDLVYIFVYSPEAGAGILSDPKIRTDQSLTCDVPDYWVGQRVHVYGFGIGVGGNISNSLYLGSGTIS